MRQPKKKAANKQPSRMAIPTFATADEEREFWASADSSDYLDWSTARREDLPSLKPSTATISLRLPESMLAELKILANERDVPYQSLLKVYLADRIRHERLKRRSA
jgi:predicted DNA binding CopG/RHH family protein